MVYHEFQSKRYSCWNNLWDNQHNNNYDSSIYFQGTSQNNPFFRHRNKEKERIKEEKIKQHHIDIINQYRNWRDLPIKIEIGYSDEIGHDTFDISIPLTIVPRIDLITFNPNKLQISVIGSIFPFNNEPNTEDDTLSEWALHHLKDEQYKKSYDLYSQISICQDNFNSKIENFRKEIKKDLEQLIKSDDDTKIELLLRYYFYKIFDESKSPNSDRYRLKDFNIVKISDEEELENPFPEKKEDIIKDLESKYEDISKQINKFKENINSLNCLIEKFQQSLTPIIDRNILGLKGSCHIEKELNKSKFRSFFHL